MPGSIHARALIGSVTILGAGIFLTAPAASAARTTPTVTVAAAQARIKADGQSTSRITVKVRNGRTVVRDAKVALTLSATPLASCGSLATLSGRTNRNGIFQTTYRSSTTTGFCTTTATIGTSKGSVVIVQTNPLAASPDSVTLSTKSTKISRDQVIGLAITVQNGGAPAANDPVMITETAGQPAACGALDPDETTTDASGQLTVLYYGSNVAGNCQLRAIESVSGASSNALVIQQSGKPAV
jgi:hypothetical protein